MRKNHNAGFKAKVAIEAIKGDKTSAELVSLYQVHPNQIRNWKSLALNGIQELFIGKRQRAEKDKEELIEELYRQIGQQKVEIDWLKKKSGLAC